jgi:hypothetical protein
MLFLVFDILRICDTTHARNEEYIASHTVCFHTYRVSIYIHPHVTYNVRMGIDT